MRHIFLKQFLWHSLGTRLFDTQGLLRISTLMERDVVIQFNAQHGWEIFFVTWCVLNCFNILVSRIMTIFIFHLEHAFVHQLKSGIKLDKAYLWNILYELGYVLFLPAAHTQVEYLSYDRLICVFSWYAAITETVNICQNIIKKMKQFKWQFLPYTNCWKWWTPILEITKIRNCYDWYNDRLFEYDENVALNVNYPTEWALLLSYEILMIPAMLYLRQLHRWNFVFTCLQIFFVFCFCIISRRNELYR